MISPLIGFFAVFVAAFLDVASNICLVLSNGFTRKRYAFTALVLIALAFCGLAIAIRAMDLSIAYALWGSLGVFGTSICGWAFFGQKMHFSAWAGIVLLICGMVLLHLA